MSSTTPTKACVPCRVRKTKCDAAAAGLPCSGCVSRNCAEKCVILTRKKRKRPGEEDEEEEAAESGAAAVLSQQPLTTTGSKAQPWSHSPEAPTPDSLDKRQSQLHYFCILRDAVDDGALDDQDDALGTPLGRQDHDDDAPRQRAPQLDDADREYLDKKGVIALVTVYFAMLEPYAPIIDRADFARQFDAGTCSLFLLYAMLATASLYVPGAVIDACGAFAGRAEAQAAFAARAALLYDFQVETDALTLLQGSLLLTKVLPEHQTEKDSNYWFYNALRLATRLQLYSRQKVTSECEAGWEIGIVFADCLGSSYLEPPKMSDWSIERIPKQYRDIVPPTTSQQKALFIAICKLGTICEPMPPPTSHYHYSVHILTETNETLDGEILPRIVQDPCVDLAQLMRPLEFWRMSLPTQLQLGDQPPNSNIHHLDVLGTSYRYEATLCRLIQRQLRSVDAAKSSLAKQRLRSAMLELDGITGKLLANDMMNKIPISLQAALDPSESELARSMARLSISQAMLALHQLREIPAIKKALPLFELILSRKKLHGNYSGAPPEAAGDAQWDGADVVLRSEQQGGAETDGGVSFDSFVQEFLEYDTLGRWEFGQLDFSRLV
ncbi:Fungal transcriptional regulatory protein [Cordyceps militaris CM01]|uniref:Fungal transcriptional regulatory protein n=1 Tax=Cordyceps militaris (strain CM01) TaxID=983644 RepID=G3J8X0_CORMM|nr:Fungal transcriptional regulatory protein [Cordyceps militaris CM01]EGX94853.1 Fungal transcriptional regulatory protein [Cordyceps militaris CM01]